MIEPNKLHRKQLFAALLTGVSIFVFALFRISTVNPQPGDSEKQLVIISGGLHWSATVKSTLRQPKLSNYHNYSPFFFAPVSINSANADVLMTLPGVGPGIVKQIIAYRNKYGNIDNESDLIKIRGIGAKRMNELNKFITYNQ